MRRPAVERCSGLGQRAQPGELPRRGRGEVLVVVGDGKAGRARGLAQGGSPLLRVDGRQSKLACSAGTAESVTEITIWRRFDVSRQLHPDCPFGFASSGYARAMTERPDIRYPGPTLTTRLQWLLKAGHSDHLLAMSVASASLPVIGKHLEPLGALTAAGSWDAWHAPALLGKIGRASCRERECHYV